MTRGRFHAVAIAMMVTVAELAPAAQTASPAQAISAAIDQVNGLDLDALIALAERQSLPVKAADAMVSAAAGTEQQSGIRANPELMLERRQQLGGSDSETALSIAWPLELGRIAPRRDAAAADRRIAETDRTGVHQRLALAVRSAYGRLLATARDLTVAAAQLETARQLVSLATERAASGTGPALEREQAAIEVAMLASRRDRLSRDLEVARLELAREVGLPSGSDLKVRGSLEAMAAAAAAEVTEPASIERRADIGRAAARFDEAQARTRAAHAEGTFDLRVFGGYVNTTMSFAQTGFDVTGKPSPIAGRFQTLGGGVTLMLPIQNRNQGAVAARQAESDAAARDLEEARRRADFDVAIARVWIAQARTTVGLIRDEALTRARANVATVTEAYSLGARPLTDVLAETRRLQQVELEFTSALLDWYDATVSLRLATGNTGGL